MVAIAFQDDWTPEKLKSHREWRAKMYAPAKPLPKRDALGAKLQVVADPEKAALEYKVLQLEQSLDQLRKELNIARAARAIAQEPMDVSPVIKLARIIGVVAKYYGLTITDLKSARRTAGVVRPRQVAMYLCRTMTIRSLPEIGRHLGGRDHTTVKHGVEKISDLILKDAHLCREVADIESLFNGAD